VGRIEPKPPPPPYSATQLQVLRGMGFADPSANKVALSTAKGDYQTGFAILSAPSRGG
jgi:hypothetical protein